MPARAFVHKRWSISAPVTEEIAEKLRGFRLTNPTENVRAMVAGWLVEHARAMDDPAAFRIFSSKSEPIQPRQCDRSRTHGAGFERHPEGAAVEPGLAQGHGRMPDRDNFSVRRRIEASAHRIAGLGNDLFALGHDGAHRYLAIGRGLSSKVERATHRRWKRKAHTSRLVQAAPPVDY
ncbi:hypothetical protein GCM10023264_14330 [Sphingomonas daechungensis]